MANFLKIPGFFSIFLVTSPTDRKIGQWSFTLFFHSFYTASLYEKKRENALTTYFPIYSPTLGFFHKGMPHNDSRKVFYRRNSQREATRATFFFSIFLTFS